MLGECKGRHLSLPHSQEKTPEPIAELPNPELNPLMNPTLGRNLGRWAEVYFTSPPEKREEAVVELLRELKASPGSPEISPSTTPTRSTFETTEITSTPKLVADPSIKCAECGHTYANPQRFCGMCGAPMGTAHSGYRAAELPPPQEFVFPQSSIFGTNVPGLSTTRTTINEGSDINWLREKSWAGENERSSVGRFPKYVPAALAIIAIGVLIYAQSRPPNPPAKPQAPAALAQQTPKASEGQPPIRSQTQRSDPPASAQMTASTPTQEPATQATPAQRPAQPEPPLPKQIIPEARPQAAAASPSENRGPAEGAKSAPPAEVSDSAGNGSQELALAEEYLSGKRGPRDSSEAAKFLWKAVGKENPSAILLLSDMYLIGDGVPKSCDQARLLLSAAVRKNVPQAAQKLHNLLNSGCP